jgi:hypothetical protein
MFDLGRGNITNRAEGDQPAAEVHILHAESKGFVESAAPLIERAGVRLTRLETTAKLIGTANTATRARIKWAISVEVVILLRRRMAFSVIHPNGRIGR